MRKKKSKNSLSAIILVAAFIVGLSLVLYPSVSNYWNSKVQSKAIVNYEQILSEGDANEFARMIKAADEYNSQLLSLQSPFINYAKIPGYNDILNIGNSGIMGYITIEKIQVQLPIYHGTSAEVLNVAVGHLKGSSLPVGGEGTHSVLSAHRGLPSAKLFSELDKLDVGDIFTITVLDRELTYEVDQVLVVLPSDTEALYPEQGKDYCTLMTCTPYGINTHRLLVRGVRIETGTEKPPFYVTADAFSVNSLIVTPIVAIPMLTALLIYMIIKHRREAKHRKGNAYWSAEELKSATENIREQNDKGEDL